MSTFSLSGSATGSSPGTRRHFMLCTSAAMALSAMPHVVGAQTSFAPPEIAPGENGWETYVDPPLIDRTTATNLAPAPNTPEAAVVLFLASRVRGDRDWQDAMTDNLDRKARKAVKQWEQWKLNAAQIKARKMRGDDRGYVSVWMDFTIDGDNDTGTDDFTVRREANGWRISGLPS